MPKFKVTADIHCSLEREVLEAIDLCSYTVDELV